MTFHGYFEFTSSKQYCTFVQAFSGSKDSSLRRLIKTMFRWIFLSLILTPYCKYNYCKNNVKFLQLTSSELLIKTFKVVPYFFEYKPRLLFIFVVILRGFYSRAAFNIFCRHMIKRAEQTSSRQKYLKFATACKYPAVAT